MDSYYLSTKFCVGLAQAMNTNELSLLLCIEYLNKKNMYIDANSTTSE